MEVFMESAHYFCFQSEQFTINDKFINLYTEVYFS